MKLKIAALVAGFAGFLWILAQIGPAQVVAEIAAAGWALPFMTCVHVSQLTLSAAAWREALGQPRLPLSTMLRTRWIREGVNSLLPVAQIGGQVVAIRLLAVQGLSIPFATAGTVLDLTVEAGSQFLFTLAGLIILASMNSGPATPAWIGVGVLLTGLGAAGFVIAQRMGLLRLLEAAVERTARSWPALQSWSLSGLHDRLMRLQSDRAAMLRATAFHTVSWSLGGVEVWLALWALGHPVSLLQAFVIESLGMAARSAGFMVPGALGVQEGGFVLAAGLFGVPAGTALSLSILKRLREILVGLPAMIAWGLDRSEIARVAATSRDPGQPEPARIPVVEEVSR